MKKALFLRRKERVRRSVRRLARGKKRLAVFRSNRHIGVQLIDDEKGVTLAQASTGDKDFKGVKSTSNIEAAKKVGAIMAKCAKDLKVTKVVFDRGPYLYHGRVKALADAIREQGLEF